MKYTANNHQEKFIYLLVMYVISTLYLFFIYKFPDEWFNDRDFYIIYANEAFNIISGAESLLIVIFNEPLFLLVAGFFGEYIGANYFPAAMSVFVSAVYLYLLIKNSRTFIIFLMGVGLLIFNPYLHASQVMVLRQGVATAIFLLIFFSNKKDSTKLILCSFLSLFHSVFFIISFIYALYIYVLKNKSSRDIVLVVAVVSTIFYLLSMKLLNLLGFRQAELYSISGNSAGGGGAFLLSIAIFIYVYFYSDKENKQLYDWSLIGLVMFITGYFLFFSPGRLFMSFFPFILLLLVSKSRIQDILFLLFVNLIYIYLFFNQSYMILFRYSSVGYVSDIFVAHLKSLLDFF